MNCRYGAHFFGLIDAKCEFYDPISDSCSSDETARTYNSGEPAGCFRNMQGRPSFLDLLEFNGVVS